MAKRTVKLTFDEIESDYYSLAGACAVLGKARSTLMRLLKSWEKVTGSEPRRDHNGRWYLNAEAVHKLRDDPKLYLQLAGRATKWVDANTALTLRTKCLEADCKALKDIISKNVPTEVLENLRRKTPLLRDI